MTEKKHLTNDERLQIEILLKEQTPFKKIAAKLSKHPATISREVRAHIIVSDKGGRYRVRNRCTKRADCFIRYLCKEKTHCTRRCSACNLCNDICPEYEEQVCYKLFEPPYCKC